MKRKRADVGETTETEDQGSSRRTIRQAHTNGNFESESEAEARHPADTSYAVETPTKPRRGRPSRTPQKPRSSPDGVDGTGDHLVIPSKGKQKPLFLTPGKHPTSTNQETGAPIVRNADRSARRKSARTLIEPTADAGLSEEEDLEEDGLLARKIWEADEADSGEEDNEVEDGLAEESTAPQTPSKRKRGRRKNSPTPLQNLPPHERYFWQNRPGKVKTSNNTLSSLSLLSHEQYHNKISAYEDLHTSSYDYLHSIHSRSFPQWRFEFSQSFNICLYGYGSKRKLVTAFAKYLHTLTPTNPPKILIVNGYTPTLTLRHLLTTLATLIFNCTPSTLPSNLGTQPREILTSILSHLRDTTTPISPPYHIFINSLDASPLRRSPTPALLAQLASSPHIKLLATCDTPNFPLLWSTPLLDQYNFLFHDTTTYLSYGHTEIPSVIDSVNELLNRSGRSVEGKEGVGFVLRSLPENARNLYRVLVAEILASMDEEQGGGEVGVEYKFLYGKVVEEFICSNEMGFRQLLKEFYDHQMIVSRRDGGGAELLGVPWRREEMEAILEDLVV